MGNIETKKTGKWMTAISFAYVCEDGKERDGVALVKGKVPDSAGSMEWLMKKISEEPLHKRYFNDECEIMRLETVSKML